MSGRLSARRNQLSHASKLLGQKKSKAPLFRKLVQKSVRKKIEGQFQKMYAREQHLVERREELLNKTQGLPAISIGRFRLTPSAKNPREHQQILFELQNGMMPKKLLQFSEIREMAKRNPMEFQQVFDLVYKYFTGEIKANEINALKKILEQAIRKGKITDMKMAGIHQLKERRNTEIDEIQSYHKAA